MRNFGFPKASAPRGRAQSRLRLARTQVGASARLSAAYGAKSIGALQAWPLLRLDRVRLPSMRARWLRVRGQLGARACPLSSRCSGAPTHPCEYPNTTSSAHTDWLCAWHCRISRCVLRSASCWCARIRLRGHRLSLNTLGVRSRYHAGFGVAICKPCQGSNRSGSERRAASTMRALSRDDSAGRKGVSVNASHRCSASARTPVEATTERRARQNCA